MQRSALTTEERIIHATINCMEKEGIETVTIRSIAKEAGVNSAAISYYFRSKENLIQQALRYSMVQAFEDLPAFEIPGAIPEQIDIVELLHHFMGGVLHYPGLTRAHLYDPLMKSDYSGQFLSGFNVFLEKLYHRIKPRFSKTPEREVKLRLVSAFCSIIFAGMIHEGLANFTGFNLNDEEVQADFVQMVAERLLSEG